MIPYRILICYQATIGVNTLRQTRAEQVSLLKLLCEGSSSCCYPKQKATELPSRSGLSMS